jgi:3-mercaptopyruvate sulfurtransferase SseA
MTRSPVVLAFVLVLLVVAPSAARASDLLVDVAWLRAHARDADVRIIDMAADVATYRKAHIPGARYRPKEASAFRRWTRPSDCCAPSGFDATAVWSSTTTRAA